MFHARSGGSPAAHGVRAVLLVFCCFLGAQALLGQDWATRKPQGRITVGGDVSKARITRSPVIQCGVVDCRGDWKFAIAIGKDGGIIYDGKRFLVEPTNCPPEMPYDTLETVAGLRYKPTLLNGKPVEVLTSGTFRCNGKRCKVLRR